MRPPFLPASFSQNREFKPNRDWLILLFGWLIILAAVIGWRTLAAVSFQADFEAMINPDIDTRTINEARLEEISQIIKQRGQALELIGKNPPPIIDPS